MPETPVKPASTDPTVDARRNSRFTFAQRRIRKILDTAPPLTDEQREQLALILHPGGDDDAA